MFEEFVIYHGPPKPTCLEVCMVNNLVLGGQNLYFSRFWGLMVYIYRNNIYIYIYIYLCFLKKLHFFTSAKLHTFFQSTLASPSDWFTSLGGLGLTLMSHGSKFVA